MKNIASILLILLMTASALWAQMPGFPPAPGAPRPPGGGMPNNGTPNNNEAPDNSQEMIPPGLIDFQGVDVSQVLEVYAQLVGRTLLRAGLPQAQIVLKTETPLDRKSVVRERV